MPPEATPDGHTEVAANRTAEAAEHTKETAVRTTVAAQRTEASADRRTELAANRTDSQSLGSRPWLEVRPTLRWSEMDSNHQLLSTSCLAFPGEC